MTDINPKINDSWKSELLDEFNKPYFNDLKKFLITEREQHTVYPPGSLIFNALNRSEFNEIKVVIIGQDPYHGKGQAHGLSFSVQFGVKPPPSLANIFKELKADLGIPIAAHGNLEKWADQGVLLLNASLTVRANQAGSHQKKGWETFTDTIIQKLSKKREGLVFLLWGRFAQAKEGLIDHNKHHILKAAHPSPFSAHNGFFGCKHFSQTNKILREHNMNEIDWNVGEGGLFS